MNKLNLQGEVFARLTVLQESPNTHKKTAWLCLCLCGNTIVVITERLRSGHTRSCGCLHKEGRPPVHGHARTGQKTTTYKKWMGMIRRCHGTGIAKNHRWYKDKGVAVCDAWRESYQQFLDDMGECPIGYELDRIDNKCGYELGNCRWVTSIENKRNMSNNRMVTIQGETKIVSEWCELFGVKPNVVYQRIYRNWPEEEWFLSGQKRKRRV